MKVLSKHEMGASMRRAKRVMTEAAVLKAVDHPLIISLHWAFQSKDWLFYVLEYCPGMLTSTSSCVDCENCIANGLIPLCFLLFLITFWTARRRIFPADEETAAPKTDRVRRQILHLRDNPGTGVLAHERFSLSRYEAGEHSHRLRRTHTAHRL